MKDLKYFLGYTVVMYLLLIAIGGLTLLLVLALSIVAVFFGLFILLAGVLVLSKLNKRYVKHIKKSNYLYKINYLIIAFIVPVFLVFFLCILFETPNPRVIILPLLTFLVNNSISVIRHARHIYE
ncbi:hypothetical protein [Myroides odoratimimus]|uniref:Uncharacterized protein n=1 Tax=Myroides odoratimimus CIP 101113 TaxID=883154 RepID=A0AAV3F765_9FLAO|nr:hypothetical protein [Myroides odoratimimus]EHO14171.1 hypothetical protein HMPREF9715_00842 [Myroides odoratimimus CIP 101113]